MLVQKFNLSFPAKIYMYIILIYFDIAGWFGIRKSFSQFLLCSLPCLQEYGNIGYRSTRGQSVPLDSNVQLNDLRNSNKKSKDILNKKNEHMKPVVPIVSIDLPD